MQLYCLFHLGRHEKTLKAQGLFGPPSFFFVVLVPQVPIQVWERENMRVSTTHTRTHARFIAVLSPSFFPQPLTEKVRGWLCQERGGGLKKLLSLEVVKTRLEI